MDAMDGVDGAPLEPVRFGEGYYGRPSRVQSVWAVAVCAAGGAALIGLAILCEIARRM